MTRIFFTIIAAIGITFSYGTKAFASSAATESDSVSVADSCCADGLIFNRGMKVTSEYYVGDIYISPIMDKAGYDVFHLVFEPGSYNSWHIHPDADQVLLILDGEGYYQEEGKPKRHIKRGDVINTPANVKHWNGATPDKPLVHLSITAKSDSGHIQWKEAVSEEEYLK